MKGYVLEIAKIYMENREKLITNVNKLQLFFRGEKKHAISLKEKNAFI